MSGVLGLAIWALGIEAWDFGLRLGLMSLGLWRRRPKSKKAQKRDLENRGSVAESEKLDLESEKLEAEIQILDLHSRKLDAHGQKLDLQSRKLDAETKRLTSKVRSSRPKV